MKQKIDIVELCLAIFITTTLFALMITVGQITKDENFERLSEAKCHDMWQISTKEVLSCE